ncbi:MAG: nuclear transport factor 2 family protein [Pyrinomonadaceae bacterium]
MRFAFTLLALLLIVSSVALSQSNNGKKSQDQKIAEELIKLDKELTVASKRKDVAAVSPYIADDYTDISSNGRIRNKAELLAEMGPYNDGKYVEDEYVVKVYGGDTAVMTNRVTLTPYQFRATRVWIKRKGKWQAVSTHYSVIRPIGSPFPQRLCPETLP